MRKISDIPEALVLQSSSVHTDTVISHFVIWTSLSELSYYNCFQRTQMSRDGVVGIATRYGLDSQGIVNQWGRHFQHLSRPALGPSQPPVQWVKGLSRG